MLWLSWRKWPAGVSCVRLEGPTAVLDWGTFGWVVHYLSAGSLAAASTLAVAHKRRDFPRFRASLMAYAIIPDLFVALKQHGMRAFKVRLRR